MTNHGDDIQTFVLDTGADVVEMDIGGKLLRVKRLEIDISRRDDALMRLTLSAPRAQEDAT